MPREAPTGINLVDAEMLAPGEKCIHNTSLEAMNMLTLTHELHKS